MTTPPTYHNGTLFIGVPFADSLINGGLVIAADGKTGALKWVFRAVPQGPNDDGWELAKDTWRGSAKRQGGGIWTQPAIDPELGLLYINVSNPSPNYDGSSRKGTNLFTNSVVALNLTSGKLAWHFQAIHHDIWDWDLVTGPTLFDVTVDGRTIKGVGALAKSCYAYLLNRDTGQPINPMVETPVVTKTDVPNEEVWPTQPIPYTSRGIPQQPFCATYPKVNDPELAKLVRPSFHPYLANEFVITSPGNLAVPTTGRPRSAHGRSCCM
jgi:glucose dehydrogenase